MRFNSDGSEKPDFVLNKPAYRKAKILVAGDNFGCGSSREHAPWALLDFGIRCVIAPSFADIFYNNCFKNGILPIALPQGDVDKLMDDAERGANAVISIDLEKQEIRGPDGGMIKFEIDPFRKQCLLNGWDDIGLTLRRRGQDLDFEKRQHDPAALAVRRRSEDRAPRDERIHGSNESALLPGDGIGPEVMDATMRVVGLVWPKGPRLTRPRKRCWAASRIDADGRPIPMRPSRRRIAADAVLLGAVGGPKWDGLPFEQEAPSAACLRLRKDMGVYRQSASGAVLRRPEGCLDPQAGNRFGPRHPDRARADGRRLFRRAQGNHDLADGQKRARRHQVYTTSEIERICRVAFDMARLRCNKVHRAEKSNVMVTGVLWSEVVTELHKREYPDVELHHILADNSPCSWCAIPSSST